MAPRSQCASDTTPLRSATRQRRREKVEWIAATHKSIYLRERTNHSEADSAHIIGKAVHGTDDPRNGIALSKSVHWAFDRGPSSITGARPPRPRFEWYGDTRPVRGRDSSKARNANVASFPLFEMDCRRVELPKDTYDWPHLEALAWHKSEVFGRFDL